MLAILVTGVALLVPAVSSDSAVNVVSGLPSLPPLSLQIRDYNITLYLPGEINTSNKYDNYDIMTTPKCTDSNAYHNHRWYVGTFCLGVSTTSAPRHKQRVCMRTKRTDVLTGRP